MIKQEFVNKEEIKIDRDCNSRRKQNETLDFFRLTLLLLIVFFCSTSLNANPDCIVLWDSEECVLENQHIYANDGVWFMCKNCRLCQWQSSSQANWRGEYFCKGCGNKY